MEQQPRHAQRAEVLLVEDNKHDVILTEQAFKQSRMTIHLNHVKNGLDCMSFLRKEREYERAPTPDLILLDLNMPVMDGRAVLEAISEDKTLSHLPVIILTTSENEKDIYEMYRLRCSSYIVKPVDFAQFLRVIKQLSEYWFDIVVLPPLTH